MLHLGKDDGVHENWTPGRDLPITVARGWLRPRHDDAPRLYRFVGDEDVLRIGRYLLAWPGPHRL